MTSEGDESEAGRTSSDGADRPRLESLDRRVSELNSSLMETRQRADDDRRRIDETLAGLRSACGGWDERSRQLEIIVLNSSLEHCRRANSDLVVDVQLTRLSDKTGALDGRTTQLESAVDRSAPPFVVVVHSPAFLLTYRIHRRPPVRGVTTAPTVRGVVEWSRRPFAKIYK